MYSNIAVVPPAPGIASGRVSPATREVPAGVDPKVIALLSGPQADLTARLLLALAGRRPDLSDLQRHELFLASRLHLVIRKAGFIIPPTRADAFRVDRPSSFRGQAGPLSLGERVPFAAPLANGLATALRPLLDGAGRAALTKARAETDLHRVGTVTQAEPRDDVV